MNSVLITAGNRGLGLGIVKALSELKSAPKHIITTCRKTSKSDELQALAANHSNIKILNLDMKDTDDYDRIVSEVTRIVGDQGLNVLINNAGIADKFGRLGTVKADKLRDAFNINTVAPIMFTQAMLPHLKIAADLDKEGAMGPSRAVVVNISSILGSISNNKDGGFYSYICSKAALNAATKSMSIDLKSAGIMAVAIHPGWVKTSMGGPKAPLTTDQACPVFVSTVASLTPDHNGDFIDYRGKPIPW